jgi:hypothetical protein
MPPKAHHHHLAGIVRFSPAAIRRDVKAVEGFNAKLAVIITSGVGTMACAYAFALLALVSLPDKVKEGKKGIIEWVAQTFLQLVLLSIILVGQRVAGKQLEVQAAKQFQDTEQILDLMSTETEGGLKTVINRLDAQDLKLAEISSGIGLPG